MSERFADVPTGMRLCYELLGDPAGEPLLLVMGLGTQMIAWPDAFCAQLGDRGFRVIRFDNRDIGRSTKLRDHRPPTLTQIALRSRGAAAYSVDDMALDAVGLLDVLGLESAHVAGVSMGGMIAQQLAARHPARVRSLASIMSTTGSRRVGQPATAVLPFFLRRPGRDPEAIVRRAVDLYDRIGSPGFQRDGAELRRQIRRGIERSGGGDQAGTGRQLQAILASGDRTAALQAITAPTVVVHGRADRLIAASGGAATAKAISGARLVLVDGMGHDLPRGVWPHLIDAITENALPAKALAA